jgi:hypothetical protein
MGLDIVQRFLVGLGAGAVITVMAYGMVVRSNDLTNLKAQAIYERECVKVFGNGWRFDRCERDAILEDNQAQKELDACVTAGENPKFNIDEFGKACSSPDDPETAEANHGGE